MTTTMIQPVTLADLNLLQQISRETFADTFGEHNTPEDMHLYLEQAYSDEKLTAELENPETRFFFIYETHQLAGYLKLNVGAAQTEKMGFDSLEIERIYIRNSYKHLGLGRALIKKALEIAKQEHRSDIWLGVWENNYHARKFYQQLGFEQVGAHTFVLGNDRQTDFILKKPLA